MQRAPVLAPNFFIKPFDPDKHDRTAFPMACLKSANNSNIPGISLLRLIPGSRRSETHSNSDFLEARGPLALRAGPGPQAGGLAKRRSIQGLAASAYSILPPKKLFCRKVNPLPFTDPPSQSLAEKAYPMVEWSEDVGAVVSTDASRELGYATDDTDLSSAVVIYLRAKCPLYPLSAPLIDSRLPPPPAPTCAGPSAGRR